MRVVAGAAGGRRLTAPSGGRLRPTSERVREAVFASLGSLGAVEGASVLDLFAGTGALGIEALSRGAVSATFVDDDARAVAAIRANLAVTGFTSAATVVRRDVIRFLDDGPGRYDLVFADPPYEFDGWAGLLDRLRAPVAVLESRRPVEPRPGWETIRTRTYGDTAITIVERV